MTYTLVAHREGQRETRGYAGCSEEFIHEVALSRTHLIERIAQLRAEEDGYDEVLYFEDRMEPEDPEEYLGPDESIHTEAMKLVPPIIAARKEKQRLANEASRKREQEYKDQQELIQYGRLKEKFEGKS